MASARAVESLKSLITCDICFLEFEGRDPRSLPCLHTYCRPCIQKVYDTAVQDKRHGVDRIICPICQRDAPLPNGIVSALPRYFQASQMTDILKNFQTLSVAGDDTVPEPVVSSHDSCTSCEVPGTGSLEFCFTCAQSLCNDCVGIHRNNSRFSTHVRIVLGGRSLYSFTCQEHDKFFGLFCTDCWKPICKRCELTSHATHAIKEFRNPCAKKRLVVADIDSHITSLDDDLKDIEMEQDDFENHLSEVEDEVIAHKEKLVRQIEAQANLARLELSKIREDTSKKFSDSKIRIRRTRDIVQELEKEMHQIVDPLQLGIELGLEDDQTFVDRVKERIPTRREHSSRKQKRFSFIPDVESVFFGFLSNRNEPDMKESEDMIDGSDESDDDDSSMEGMATINVAKFIINRESTMKRMNNPHKGRRSVSALLLTIQSGTNVQNVCFLADGKIVVIVGSTWSSPSKMNAYNPKGELTKLPFKTTAVKRPYCVASHHGSHKLAVAGWSKYGYCINSFFPSGGFWKSRYQDMPYEPWAMAFTTEGEIVIGTNKRILKYQANGRILIFEKQTTHYCRHIAVGSNGRIIVTDGQFIHIYTSTANKMFSFPQTKAQQLQPCGLCVDSKNNIIVADGESKAVLLFSQCGTFIRELINLSSVGSPLVMALYRDRYLIVCVGGKTLNLFDVPL